MADLFGTLLNKYKHIIDSAGDEEVISEGPSTQSLPKGIHRLWWYERWRNVELNDAQEQVRYTDDNPQKLINHPQVLFPSLIYDRMRPALRVATRMLERAKPALLRIMKANLSLDGNHLTDFYETNWGYEVLNDTLLILARQYIIVHYKDNYPYSRTVFELCPSNVTSSSTGTLALHERNRYVITGFAREFIQAFDNPHWESLPQFRRSAISICFAARLIHEVAHAIWIWTRYPNPGTEAWETGPRIIPEPKLHVEDPFAPELGEAVQRYLFGGCIMFHPNNPPQPHFDGRSGVGLAKLDFRNSAELPDFLWLEVETVYAWYYRQIWTQDWRDDGHVHKYAPPVLNMYLTQQPVAIEFPSRLRLEDEEAAIDHAACAESPNEPIQCGDQEEDARMKSFRRIGILYS